MDETRRITITLQLAEVEALRVVAKHERRDVRNQAAVLLREELERRGLLRQAGQPGRGRQGATHEQR